MVSVAQISLLKGWKTPQFLKITSIYCNATNSTK